MEATGDGKAGQVITQIVDADKSLLQKGSSAHLSPVSTSFSWLIFKNEHHN